MSIIFCLNMQGNDRDAGIPSLSAVMLQGSGMQVTRASAQLRISSTSAACLNTDRTGRMGKWWSELIWRALAYWHSPMELYGALPRQKDDAYPRSCLIVAVLLKGGGPVETTRRTCSSCYNDTLLSLSSHCFRGWRKHSESRPHVSPSTSLFEATKGGRDSNYSLQRVG